MIFNGKISKAARLLSLLLLCLAGRSPAQDAVPAKVAPLLRQARALSKSGQDAEAIRVAQQALALSEQMSGTDHPANAQSLYQLARFYCRVGRYTEAAPLYQRVLAIREKALGTEHPETAAALFHLGWFEANLAHYRRAAGLFERALAIREKHFGRQHRASAECLNALAVVNENTGNYPQAEALYQEALAIQKKTPGAEHPITATTLNNLASLYWTLGDYEQAERDFSRSLQIRERQLGLEHSDTATSLNNLALLYQSLGDLARAETLFKRVLQIRRKILGPEHAFTITSISHLGRLYTEQGDDVRAEPLLLKSLEMREKVSGPDHPDTTRSFNDLALLYDRAQKHAQAEPLYLKALEGRKKTLGLRHPETAASLASLARHHHLMGKFAEAEPLYQEALAIQREVLGPFHPDTLKTLENLAYLQWELGRPDPARETARQAIKGQERQLNSIAAFTAEQQRLEFQRKFSPSSLAANLGGVTDLAETVLRTKGFVLDSLLEDQLAAQASQDPSVKPILDRLRLISRQLTQLEFGGQRAEADDTPSDGRTGRRETLEKQKTELESQFFRKIAGLGRARRALQIDLRQIQAALSRNTALVEFIRYEHHLGRLRFEPHYGALVLAHGQEPKWVALGRAAELEEQIRLYQRYVRRHIKKTTMIRLLRSLEERLWEPIEQALPPRVEGVVISPDGELDFVSFATLLTADQQFLGQKHILYYMTNGRDLLWRSPSRTASKDLLIFANPVFTGKTGSHETRLTPLPGTRREANFLSGQASSWGLAAATFLGSQASEPALDRVVSPRVLHLATHGLLLNEDDLPGAKSSLLHHPMRRSVIALAGAQATLDSWQKGRAPPVDADGIVSAEEVAGLDLRGTWLAVLSGCDTGTGEARAGEGVLGLRRGFIRAGAENLLVTLWAIEDDHTVRIIQDFYSRAMTTGNAPRALAETQRDWLVRLRNEEGLSTAVRIAGPFILSFQGPLPGQ